VKIEIGKGEILGYEVLYIRNTAYIPSNWKDIRITDINELSEIARSLMRVYIKPLNILNNEGVKDGN